MALTNSVKGDEIAKQDNEVSTEKPVEVVEPIRSRTSQRKAATAAVNAMKEQALGVRRAENEDDEGKPKRAGRGRPKAISEKSVAKISRKRAASTDEEDEEQPKAKRGKRKAASKPVPKKKKGAERSSGRRPGRPSKAAKEEAVKESEEENKEDDDKAEDKADESNSGEEDASKTD